MNPRVIPNRVMNTSFYLKYFRSETWADRLLVMDSPLHIFQLLGNGCILRSIGMNRFGCYKINARNTICEINEPK
jgi:hypothetical protein